jgi:hypothetical protein
MRAATGARRQSAAATRERRIVEIAEVLASCA